MAGRFTRRSFMKGAIAAGSAAVLARPRRVFAAAEPARLRCAAVGIANQGGSDLNAIVGSDRVDVVALCDIDANYLQAAAAKYPNARTYRDWRELLDKEQGNIDAVSVSTPDHMHAPIALSAIQLKKHVYCEKPLTHEVFETRKVVQAAREAGVVTQMGIQIHSHAAYRQAVRIIQDGVIGKVREWHSWITASYGAPGAKRPEGEDPIPESVDWDLWLGVAPARPYKNEIYHPKKWRHWRDFGSGGFGDFGCHIFDPVFTALGLGAPASLKAEVPEFDREVWPSWEIVEYEFPGGELTAGDTIKGIWYDGGKQPPADLLALPEGQSLPESGSIIVGEEGTMLLPHYKRAQLFPVEKYKDYALPDIDSKSHYAEWALACLGEGNASANFDYAGPLTESVLLGNIAACFPGTALQWNSADLRFVDAPEADKLLRRPYRDGWVVEGLS